MKRLLTICLLLIVMFSLIAVVSISIGRGQPASKAVQYWHLTDCAPPCWAGITPNSTSVSVAIDRVNKLFGDFRRQSDAPTLMWKKEAVSTGRGSIINLLSDGIFASNIMLITTSQDGMWPTLGELMTIFGSPTCVADDPYAGYLLLHYENAVGQVVLHIGVDQLAVTKAPRLMVLDSVPHANCKSLATIPWRGLRSTELYLAEMANRK